MTTQVQTLPRLDPHLVYGIDAVASLAMGLALLPTADVVTQLVGWTLPPSFLWTIALLLLPWAAFNAWIARAAFPPRFAVTANIAGDIAWVVGSLALVVLYAPTLSAIGLLLLAGQGIAVTAVLALKLVGAGSLADR